MNITITPNDVKFAIGIHQQLVLNNVTDTTITETINRVKSEVTVGIPTSFKNTELVRSIILAYIKYYFWARMNQKDVPEHIREERKSYAKILEQIREGRFIDAAIDGGFVKANKRIFDKFI